MVDNPTPGEPFTDDDRAGLADAQAEHPKRDITLADYAGRHLLVFKPTESQAAALARLAASGRMDDIQRVANLLDIIEMLLVDQADRTWLSNVMLGGEIDLGTGDEDGTETEPTALGLFRVITRAFTPEGNNRAERRKARRTR